MSEIFIIKDTGKGVITGLTPDKVVPIKTTGGTTGDYIPLSGTEVGKPVTGSIEVNSDEFTNIDLVNGLVDLKPLFEVKSDVQNSPLPFTNLTLFELKDTEETIASLSACKITSNQEYLKFIGFGLSKIDYFNLLDAEYIFGIKENSNNLDDSGIFLKAPLNTGGLNTDIDYSDYYKPNNFVQKVYVDRQHSYSMEEKATGGTWINGKPIYRNTIIFNQFNLPVGLNQSIPLNISDLDTPVKKEFVVDWRSDNGIYTCTDSYVNSDLILQYSYIDNCITNGVAGFDFSVLDSLIVTIFYTKTTD